MAAHATHRYASGLLVIPAALPGRPACLGCPSATRILVRGVRPTAEVYRRSLRHSAAAGGGDRLHPKAGTGVRRSRIRLRTAAPGAGDLSRAAAARVRGTGAAAATHRTVCAANADLPAGAGVGKPAAIRGSAAEQRDLQQRA